MSLFFHHSPGSYTEMNITVYCYDHTGNPRCGGGGAYRTQIIHQRLAERHSVSMYFGYYKGAVVQTINGAVVRFLGFGSSYLLSRLTFSLIATIHSLFRKSDLIVVEFSVFSPVFTFLFRPKTTVMQIHHLINREPLRKYGVFGLLPMAAEKIFLTFSRYMVTSADSVATLIHEKHPYITTKATYNGVEDGIYSTVVSDGRYILTLGRLDVYMKGLDILLDAFDSVAAEFFDHRLIIAGRGREKDVYWLNERMLRSPNAARIEIRCNVSNDQKIALLRGASFLCMPSRFEGWNIVAIEAAASSKPTLGTEIYGLKDTIRNNETGLLVPAGDVTALAAAMRRLLSDKELRTRFSENGYRWARTFCWDEITRNQERFYERVLGVK